MFHMSLRLDITYSLLEFEDLDICSAFDTE